MSRHADYLRALRKKTHRGRHVVGEAVRSLWNDGCHEAIGCYSRGADVLVIRHRFSMRVLCTVLLPVGLIDDLWGQAREDVIMSFLRKAQPTQNGTPSGVVAPAGWAHDCPALTEYLFSEQYPDGSRRQRATLTVMAGDAAGVKVVLNDREEGRSLWANGEDLDTALEVLDNLLQSSQTPWRLDKQPKGGHVKK
jgi:hypothetical protein